MIRRAPRPEIGYTLLDNETLRDPEISFLALGVLCSVLSRPDNWTTGIKALAKERKEGRAAISAALDDLETAGYLRRERVQGDGGLWRTEVVFYDRPQEPLAAPSPEGPEPGEPKPGNTGPGENLEFPQVAPSPANPGPGEPGLGEPGLGEPGPGMPGLKSNDLSRTTDEEETKVNPGVGAHAREVALIERDDMSPGFLTEASGSGVGSANTPSITAEFGRQVKATTEEIMSGWQEWVGRKLPSIVVVEVGKIVKRCVADGVDPDAIKLGLGEWTSDGLVAPKYRLEPAIAGAVARRLKREPQGRPSGAQQRASRTAQTVAWATGKTPADMARDLENALRSRPGGPLAIGGTA